jgi:hypothetical protein
VADPVYGREEAGLGWGNTGMMSETITLVAIRYERKNTYFCKLARIPQHQLSIY